MPLNTPRFRAGRGATACSGDTNTTDMAIRESQRVSGNLRTARSLTIMLSPASPINAQSPKPLSPPQAVETYGVHHGYIQPPGDSLYEIGAEVAASSYTPLPPPDLEIFFGFQRHPTSVGARVAYFSPPYPPSLEIFLVMLQIRHEMLEEENISGVYLGNESGELKAFGDMQGRAETWDVVMDILFKTTVSVKVYVEAKYPVKTYCTCITKSID